MATKVVDKPKRMQITFTVCLKAGIKHDKEAGVYVAYAPALDLYSQGTTSVRAERALQSAIRSLLIVAYNKGILDEFLKNTGFSEIQGRASIGSEEEYIHVLEEEILERENFGYIFEIPTYLKLEKMAV